MLEAIKFALGVMCLRGLFGTLIIFAAWTVSSSAWFIFLWAFVALVVFGLIVGV